MGHFPRAGDFHIGEFEADEISRYSWGMRLLLNVYRMLGKYGEQGPFQRILCSGDGTGLALGYFLSMGATT